MIITFGISTDMDLISERYINTWIKNNPETEPDPQFGEVVQDEDGNRFIQASNHTPTHTGHQESLSITFLNEMVLSADFERFSATELTGTFTRNRWNVAYGTRPFNMGTRYAGKFGLHGSTYHNFAQTKVQ